MITQYSQLYNTDSHIHVIQAVIRNSQSNITKGHQNRQSYNCQSYNTGSDAKQAVMQNSQS